MWIKLEEKPFKQNQVKLLLNAGANKKVLLIRRNVLFCQLHDFCARRRKFDPTDYDFPSSKYVGRNCRWCTTSSCISCNQEGRT